MKSVFKFVTVFLFAFASTSNAQVVVKNDTIGNTPVVISMDQKVDDLLTNMEEKCATDIVRSNTPRERNEEPRKPRVTVPEKELSKAEICRRNPRIMGYKIQLAVVKSNAEAREIGLYFRRRFPNMKVEIDASLRPNYKVMAGSYVSRQSAASDLAKVKPYFKQAVAIQYRVFCVEAK